MSAVRGEAISTETRESALLALRPEAGRTPDSPWEVRCTGCKARNARGVSEQDEGAVAAVTDPV